MEKILIEKYINKVFQGIFSVTKSDAARLIKSGEGRIVGQKFKELPKGFRETKIKDNLFNLNIAEVEKDNE